MAGIDRDPLRDRPGQTELVSGCRHQQALTGHGLSLGPGGWLLILGSHLGRGVGRSWMRGSVRVEVGSMQMTPSSSLRCTQLCRGLIQLLSGSPRPVGGDGHAAADHPGAEGCSPGYAPHSHLPSPLPSWASGTILGATLGSQPPAVPILPAPKRLPGRSDGSREFMASPQGRLALPGVLPQPLPSSDPPSCRHRRGPLLTRPAQHGAPTWRSTSGVGLPPAPPCPPPFPRPEGWLSAPAY